MTFAGAGATAADAARPAFVEGDRGRVALVACASSLGAGRGIEPYRGTPIFYRGRRAPRSDSPPRVAGFGLPRGVRGRPALAYGDEAARILARIASLSRRYGTRIEPVDDAARISLD
jgi:hypothetical protein